MKISNLKLALASALIAMGLSVPAVHAGDWSAPLTLAGVVTDSDGGLRYAELTADGPCPSDKKSLWMSPAVSVEGKKAVLAALLTALASGMPIKYYGECDSQGYNRISFVRVGN